MLNTRVQATRWIVDNVESDAVTAALTRTFPCYCGPRSTAAVLTLISAVVYPLLLASSNRRIALN